MWIRYAVNSEKTQETSSKDGAPLHRFVLRYQLFSRHCP